MARASASVGGPADALVVSGGTSSTSLPPILRQRLTNWATTSAISAAARPEAVDAPIASGRTDFAAVSVVGGAEAVEPLSAGSCGEAAAAAGCGSAAGLSTKGASAGRD